MKLLEDGTKVKYTYAGEEHEGIIHGVRTYEDEQGLISRVTYLIDTGEVIREAAHFGFVADDDGYATKELAPIPDEIEFTHTLEQHAQVEVDQNFVKLA